MKLRKFTPLRSAADGEVFATPALGKFLQGEVAYAFERMGGGDRLADWADKNPGEFFTKLLPKLLPKQVEVTASDSIDERLRRLDAEREANTINITPTEGDGG